MRFQPYSVAGDQQNPGSAPAPVSPALRYCDRDSSVLDRPLRWYHCLLFLFPLMLAVPCPAQSKTQQSTPSSTTAPASSHRRVHLRHHAHAVKKETPIPAAPPPPLPPAQQPARPAEVSFSQGLLTIHADNSSLVDILTQISRSTGLQIQGLSHDQRIYGAYGPGKLTATISKLLDGSGYDYVIVGGTGSHAPSKLLLTQASSSAPPGIASSASVANVPYTPAQETPAMADPSAPVAPKTPQQIFDELRKMHPQQQ